MNFLRQEWE